MKPPEVPFLMYYEGNTTGILGKTAGGADFEDFEGNAEGILAKNAGGADFHVSLGKCYDIMIID